MERATDFRQLKAQFNAFLTAARAVRDALDRNREARRLPAFVTWWEKKKAELEADALLSYMARARNSNTHEGEHHLRVRRALHVGTVSIPPKGTIELSAEGIYRVADFQ